MEKKEELTQELPIKEKKYNQTIEDLNKVITLLKNEMNQCPSEDITFNLVEVIDQYSLIRTFKLKSNSKINNINSLNTFKESILTNISTLGTFIIIPKENPIDIEIKTDKENKFIPDKIYNINGDEIDPSNFFGKQSIIFYYDNLVDLTSFITRNKNINHMIYCIGINMNFFSTKKSIKNNGLYVNKMFNFCFIEVPAKDSKSPTNLKINNLPRISAIGADGLIYEDKPIKNISDFDIQKDFVNKIGQKENENEELAKNEKFLNLENEIKKKTVKSINKYLKKNGLNNASFYVKSKICIDKKGIRKTRCYPVLYGEAKIDQKI